MQKQSLGLKTHSVQVGVSSTTLPLIRLWHVIVDDDVDALNVNSSSNQVGGNQNALLTLLELLVDIKPAVVIPLMNYSLFPLHIIVLARELSSPWHVKDPSQACLSYIQSSAV